MKTPVAILRVCLMVAWIAAVNVAQAETIKNDPNPKSRNARQNRNNRNKPPPQQKKDDQAAGKKDQPGEKPPLFKDLADGATFHFTWDKDQMAFPYVKVSANTARSVPTVSNPNATIVPMSPETAVVTDKKHDKGADQTAKAKKK